MADDKNEDDTTSTKTIQKTLWSETLIEMLILSLQKNMSDQKVTEFLMELKQKNYKASYITDKVKRSLGDEDALRVKNLMMKLKIQ